MGVQISIELLKKCKAGDESAFRHLVETYQTYGYALAVRFLYHEEDARDIVQESFTRYLETYGDGDCNPPLLFVIARNFLVDHYRSTKRNIQFLESHLYQDNSEEYIIVREEYRRILSAFEKLDDIERELLEMVVHSKNSYNEIAEIKGYSVSNVKIKVHRARAKGRRGYCLPSGWAFPRSPRAISFVPPSQTERRWGNKPRRT